jgi:hypothetical protein
MRLRLRAILLAGAILAVPGAARGWSDDGHRLGCEIAWLEMEPATRRQVLDLLETGHPAYQYFSTACLWADREGRRGPYRNTLPLHYVNVDVKARRVDLARDCREGCVISAIVQHVSTLMRRDTVDAERLEALRFLAHFVVDVHQPLHVAFAEDRGGTRAEVEFLGRAWIDAGRSRPMTLHRVWDGELLREGGLDPGRIRDEARRLHAGKPHHGFESDEDLDPLRWADESLAVVRELVYAGPRLDKGYLREAHPVALSRLDRSGRRLGKLLNRIFGAIPPFWIARRGGRVYHHPGCSVVPDIDPGRLEIHASPPPDKRRHRGCRAG